MWRCLASYLPVVLVVDSLVWAHALHQKFSLERHVARDGHRLGYIELRVLLGPKRILDGIPDQRGIELLQDIGQGQVLTPCWFSTCRENEFQSAWERLLCALILWAGEWQKQILLCSMWVTELINDLRTNKNRVMAPETKTILERTKIGSWLLKPRMCSYVLTKTCRKLLSALIIFFLPLLSHFGAYGWFLIFLIVL